jgi:hypothetical protein
MMQLQPGSSSNGCSSSNELREKLASKVSSLLLQTLSETYRVFCVSSKLHDSVATRAAPVVQ